MKGEVWIIDDEKGILEVLTDILKDEGYSIKTFLSGKKAVEELPLNPPQVVFLDLWLKDMDGFEVLKKIKVLFPFIPVIIISGHGTIETAVKAIKLGAYDFIEKPLSYERILITLENAFKLVSLEEENRRLRENIFGRVKLSGISPAIKEIKELILKAAPTDTTVLIFGESGVGKELVAKLIHLYSTRAKGPFVEINCAGIPDTLIEAELFGYEKGAFTGAQTSKKGKFEQAEGGTIFLDEVGDMSLSAQAKVLRVLQERKIERLGGVRPIEVDVRIIGATNKNLQEEIKKGNFREDLFYRLNVFPIYIPPLRERKEDIPFLVEEFLEELALKTGLGRKRLKGEVLSALMKYHWPGNVRELKNFIERLVIISPDLEITYEDLPLDFRNLIESLPSKGTSEPWFQEKDYKTAKWLFEKEFLRRKLLEFKGNISQTAKEIGLERAYLQKKIKELGLKEDLKEDL
ncbi:MAG: sigma-54 dependent transcriptional regulator [Thermodesulfobacteriaceae bacterium]|nr:sigma-54 dependent transcriptional regulator [Thermodesulfobacteriaceae bacterium]MCX8042369.1 sigma-54 dependent transcriptional regulator [Thermodesulfobacteriaceae bacterium]MDW8135837.1 sigma-54 dependent transcriptional regulator [Thermodesulfobacterium sp.]